MITEEIALYYRSRWKRSHDPYKGHTLAVVHNPTAKDVSAVICFPMGELGNQLSELLRLMIMAFLTARRHLSRPPSVEGAEVY